MSGRRGDAPAGDTVVLITGAAGRLGRSIAAAMTGQGVVLAVNDLEGTSPAAGSAGGDPKPLEVEGDVSDAAVASRVVDTVVDRLGALDVLVNVAGIEGPIAPIEQLEPDDVVGVFAANIFSVFWMCRAAVPHLKSSRGRVVNLASGAGLAGTAHATPYNASKHAVVGLTRSLARELGPHGVAVNAVCPGYVDSPMLDRIATAAGRLTGGAPDYAGSVPARRLGTPDEVAKVVSYLALEAPTYLTGTCVVVDGGLRA